MFLVYFFDLCGPLDIIGNQFLQGGDKNSVSSTKLALNNFN